MHSDQINKSEHGGTDWGTQTTRTAASDEKHYFLGETAPGLSSMGEGNFWSM